MVVAAGFAASKTMRKQQDPFDEIAGTLGVIFLAASLIGWFAGWFFDALAAIVWAVCGLVVG